MFETFKMFDNKDQIVANNEITIWLNSVTSPTGRLQAVDAAHGTMMAAIRFWISTRYEQNHNMQFSVKDKEELLKLVSDTCDTQLNQLHIQQALPH